MQKVNVNDIANHEGEILARDVIYSGRLLFQSNYIIDKPCINRILELKDEIVHIFTYSSDTLNDDITNLITDDTLDIIKKEMNLVFSRYSYSGTEDIDLLLKALTIQKHGKPRIRKPN